MNQPMIQRRISRRELLQRAAGGFGAIALSALLAESGAVEAAVNPSADPLAPGRPISRRGPSA